jgi:hypothetical protein
VRDYRDARSSCFSKYPTQDAVAGALDELLLGAPVSISGFTVGSGPTL